MHTDTNYKTLPLAHSDRVALIDAADFPRLSRYNWKEQGGRVWRECKAAGGRWTRRSLSHELLNLARSEKPKFINGNPLDFRRANLRAKAGNVYLCKESKRNPYCVQFFIDRHTYSVGRFPQRGQAEEMKDKLADLVRSLRGRNLTRRQIQRQLDLAAGRAARRYASARAAAELMRGAAAVVPAHLPADVREEAAQAIAVDLLTGAVARDELDSQRVRRYVRAAFGLRDLFRFRSLDAPLGEDDGRTLADVLVA